MNDGDALLAAIIANPDDDTPRLVYADWLQENGQPERAEFIRLQCPTSGASADNPATVARAFDLEERYSAKWLVGLPSSGGVNWTFRRGFPEILHIAGEFLMERYEKFSRIPWTRCLCISGVLDWVARDFANREWSDRWIELRLRTYPLATDFTPTITAISNCVQTCQLRLLQFSGFQLSPQGVVELSESPYLAELQELRLDGNPHSLLLAPLRDRFGTRLVVEQV
jgi:uncharacterized protein (TIGR02996 family)